MKYLLIAVLGGLLGGMGMGGGTLLIPLLTLLMSVEQKSAQLLNILAFIPMAILTIILNHKKHLIEWKYIIYVSLSGVIGAIFGALLVDKFDPHVLRIAFGVFLIVIAVYLIVSTLVKYVRQNRCKTLTEINVIKHGDDED